MKKRECRDVWYVKATTDMLAAGREELRDAIAELIREAIARGDAGRSEGWLKELERGRVLKEGWPKYYVALTRSGALDVRFGSIRRDRIQREKQRLENMGLVKGEHFTVKMPEGGKAGYVSILKEGLAYAAWLSVYGKDEDQRKLAAALVELILQRAKERGNDVRKKAEEIVKEGKARGSLKLEGFEKEFEVNGKTYVVKVRGGEAVEEDRGGRKLLRIRITAEVDGVTREYEITYGRYEKNTAKGFAVARADAPGGR